MKPGPKHARLRRVPGIDGLRGLAVIAVMLYHFFRPTFNGGFLGVDIFFVLSGFLITSLLIRERATTGRVSLKNFWLRRIKRILPAAFTVMFVVAAITLIIAGNSQVQMGSQMLAILTFSNNWVQIVQSHSYFADTVPQVFSHYWSLSVEEQFYVLWPLLFVALCALGARRKHWLIITSLIAITSAALMGILFTPGVDPTRVYYGTDTHAFGLILGAFLAFWMSSRSASALADSWPKYQTEPRFRRTLQVNSVIALVGLIALCIFLPDQSAITYRGGIVLASVLTAVVLFTIVQEIGPIHHIFQSKVLRWLGVRSFSLYLWHWPLMVIISEPFRAHGEQHSLVAGFIALAIALPLSAFWYKYIETPFRRYGIKATFQKLFAPLKNIRHKKWQSVRAIAISLISVVTISLGIASGVTAPNESQIERDLQALRTRGTSGRPGLARLWLPELEERDFPEGEDITALGDSVMLASLPELEKAFPGIYVNADVSRFWSWAPLHIEQMKKDGTLDHFVVIGLGTNGSAAPGEIDTVMRALGPDRVIVLVTPYGDRPWMDESLQQIMRTARKYHNVYIADWNKAVRNNPNVVREDGIHPGEEGGRLYARLIRNALMRWVNYGPTIAPNK